MSRPRSSVSPPRCSPQLACTPPHPPTLELTVLTGATREEMAAARLPLPYRDSCAHLLIPLNKCRQEEFYLPWKCEVRRACGQLRRSGANGQHRQSVIRTRSASMRSSRSASQRWRSCGHQRTERGAIEHASSERGAAGGVKKMLHVFIRSIRDRETPLEHPMNYDHRKHL